MNKGAHETAQAKGQETLGDWANTTDISLIKQNTFKHHLFQILQKLAVLNKCQYVFKVLAIKFVKMYDRVSLVRFTPYIEKTQ